LAFNPVSGDLYVAEAWNRRVQVFSPDGVALRAFTVNMWFNNQQSYNRPYLAVSPDGTLIYVTDMDDRHRIVAYDLTGQPVFSFNQPDNLEQGLLGLRNPAGLAFDATGRLYVVDADQAKVYVFPPSQVTGSLLPVSPSNPVGGN
jgi:sugar lactone lactonase YvrE